MLTGVVLDPVYTRKQGGQPYGLIQLDNEHVIEKQIIEMKKICQEIILVTEEPRDYLSIIGNSIRIITDFYQGLAPLSSLHAALSLAKHDYLWVVSSNRPYISAVAADAMVSYGKANQLGVVLPSLKEIDFYHSIYTKSCLPVTEALLAKRQSQIADLLMHVTYQALPEKFFSDQGLSLCFVQQLTDIDIEAC